MALIKFKHKIFAFLSTLGKLSDYIFYMVVVRHLGRVLGKRNKTNARLEVDHGFYFLFLLLNKSVLWRLRLSNIKIGKQKICSENITEKLTKLK